MSFGVNPIPKAPTGSEVQNVSNSTPTAACPWYHPEPIESRKVIAQEGTAAPPKSFED
jgi:hypothetical protein